MLHSDSCGLFSIFLVYLSYSSITYYSVTYAFSELYKDYSFVSGIFIGLVALSLLCHLAAVLIDPGTVTQESSPLVKQGLSCSICNVNKAPRTHHCTICKKCIINMDHHCPWINNCVGFKNQKHFILFLVYTALASSWSLVTMLLASFNCINLNCGPLADPFVTFMSAFTSTICLFFFIICLISLKEQIRVVWTNISEIDILQMRKFRQRSLKVNFEEVFGGPFSLSWFFPVPIKTAPVPVQVVSDIYSHLSSYEL